MLEYGSVTGLPDKYRIILAISVALLLHTLVMATLPFSVPDTESHRQTVRVELVSPGSIPLPESAASEITPAHQTSPAPSPISEQREVIAAESSRIDTNQPRQREQTPDTTPPPQTAVKELQPQSRTPPTRNSVATAAGSPEQPREEEPEVITRITPSPREEDPYTSNLAAHIAKELGKRPVRDSSRVSEPVSSQIELRLLPNGALTGATVTKSTGFGDIDRAIHQAALLASPYPKPPEEYSGRKRFRVEVIVAPERL